MFILLNKIFPAPFVVPFESGNSVLIEVDRQPYVIGDGCIFSGKLSHILRKQGFFGLIVPAVENVHKVGPTGVDIKQPTVCGGNIEILAGNLDNAGDLAVEGGALNVTDTGLAVLGPGAREAVGRCALGGVGEFCGGSRGEHIPLVVSAEDGGRFSDEGNASALKELGIFARNVGVILGEGHNYHTAMHALEHNVGDAAVGVFHKVKVARKEAAGVNGMLDLKWTVNIGSGQDNHILVTSVVAHDLDPHNEFLVLFVVEHMGSVHL